MKKALFYIGKKSGFLIAIVLAAIIGGATTGFVVASIPDANGDLQTCYRNNGGDLRVIDTANMTCSNNETALNISSAVTSSSTAMFRIKNGAIDTGALRNLTSYQWYDGTGAGTEPGYCLEAIFDPRIGIKTVFENSMDHLIIRSQSNDDNNFMNDSCASNFNAFVRLNGEFDNVTAWLSK